MRVWFLDESGDHKLGRRQLASSYPIFVLGGVIIDRTYLRAAVEPELSQFKGLYFGRTDIILHTVEMRNGTGVYAFLADPAVRRRFFTDLNGLLQTWRYTVIGCVIDKPRYAAQFAHPADPYHYSLDVLVERFCWELGAQIDAGFICAEKRGDDLDRLLLAAWETLRARGTSSCSARRIDERIVGLDLRDKKPNLAGLQLADLVVSPIGRSYVGQPAKPDQVQWSIVQRKLQRIGATDIGTGLVIRP